MLGGGNDTTLQCVPESCFAALCQGMLQIGGLPLLLELRQGKDRRTNQGTGWKRVQAILVGYCCVGDAVGLYWVTSQKRTSCGELLG